MAVAKSEIRNTNVANMVKRVNVFVEFAVFALIVFRGLFYKKLGFKRMITALAIFKNQAEVLASGIVVDEP
jgi:hypothetical protein